MYKNANIVNFVYCEKTQVRDLMPKLWRPEANEHCFSDFNHCFIIHDKAPCNLSFLRQLARVWKKWIMDNKTQFSIWRLSQRILDVSFTMSDPIISTSGYFVIDDNNNNNNTADSDGPDMFMSEAKSYTIYKIGE